MIVTDAWVINSPGADADGPAILEQKSIRFADPAAHEVLVEPVYGCWEGNMHHAWSRRPIDINIARQEQDLVIGNSGVVRVLRCGSDQHPFSEGDYCWVFPGAETDASGYMRKALAYDAAGTMGMLSKLSKLPAQCLVRIPDTTRHSLKAWANFSLRYVTAWANWRVAYGCWRLLNPEDKVASPFVAAWGGGVALAQLLLARHFGARVVLISSQQERRSYCESLGIETIDRSQFADIQYQPERYLADADYKRTYLAAERRFAEHLQAMNGGHGVSIFIDNIGTPVYRASLKALARQGVLTTTGWKCGMNMSTQRAIECIAQHQHIHTHYACMDDALDAMHFAEQHDWLQAGDEPPWSWEEIPELARAFAGNRIHSFFPLYQVNPEP